MSPVAKKQPGALILDTPVEELAGVGPVYVRRLKRVEIETVRDLLRYFPRRYDDLRDVKTLDEISRFGELPIGERVTLKAKIISVNSRRSRYGKALVSAQIGSEKGTIEAIWFNQPFVAKDLKTGQEYLFSGKLREAYGRVSLQSPTYEPVKATVDGQTHTARLVPVYPERETISSKWFRQKIRLALPAANQFTEDLPEALRKTNNLPGIADAIKHIHFPETPEQAERARTRFDFTELFVMQILTQRLRASWRNQGAVKIPYNPKITTKFINSLPWKLTDDQRRATHEILKDLDSKAPMLRLLEGDVGSGKTAVAAAAANQVITAGHQVAIIAPTEVLARQHFATLSAWFEPPEIKPLMLLGSQTAKEKKEAKELIASCEGKLIIGTHALIQEDVDWSNLALAIVDEQHRFGVEQRKALRGQTAPHLLSMTATPIPRSLALTAYGDQDLSIIKEMPEGRVPVKTVLLSRGDRDAAFSAIREALGRSEQAFIIYPVIADSRSGLKAAEDEYHNLSKTVLAGYETGLLHGRLSAEEKDAVMTKFTNQEIEVLISTTVVEVGVDVPNATVMVIEEAQRFGLAQLHQLRGRVGRGENMGRCYLLPGQAKDDDNERLETMTKTQSGFTLAEKDLELRGPGELLGTKQSGFDVSLAGLTNPQLLKAAQTAARDIVEHDPDLKTVPELKPRVEGAVLPA
ncbi:ATP-dependent DNA helicase RecG [Patescibacteria group bacterium]|nr:ATP-dependent DNA helicase RecG [Patescibacteria group bacterium]